MMRKIWWSAPAVLMFLLTIGCAAPSSFKQADLDQMGLQLSWRAKAPQTRQVLDIYPYKSTVVIQVDEYSLFGFDRASGKSQWAVGYGSKLIGAPAEYENFLYIVSGAQISEVDEVTGFGKQKMPLKIAPVSGAIANSKYVVVSTLDNEIHALSRLEGRPQWSKNAGMPVRNRPTFGEGMVFFGSDNKTIYAVNESDGKLAWTFDAGGLLAGPMVYEKNRIYMTLFQGSVMAISRFERKRWSDKVLWEFPITEPFMEGPKLGKGLLFCIDTANHLWVIDITPDTEETPAPASAPSAQKPAESPTAAEAAAASAAAPKPVKPFKGPIWDLAGVKCVAGVSDRYAYLATPRGTLKKVDLKDGKVVAEMRLPPCQAIATNPLSGEIYLANKRGDLCQLKEKNP